jgi:hypothetical protein
MVMEDHTNPTVRPTRSNLLKTIAASAIGRVIGDLLAKLIDQLSQ